MKTKITTKMSWTDAILKVLSDAKGELHYTEIARMIADKHLVESNCMTQENSVNVYIRSNRDKIVPFGKKGCYILKEKLDEFINKYLDENLSKQQTQITSYGRFWSRKVFETNKFRLIGISTQKIKVDISNQIGIYILHRGYECVYVGQCVGQSLSSRIKEHVTDSLARRWDTFSWFGFYPIDDKGLIQNRKIIMATTKNYADALEAILIESIEPRFNDKKGNNLTSKEYQQI